MKNVPSTDAPAVTSHLPSVSVIFSLVDIEQTGQTEVGDLHVVRVLNQNIAGGQISVDQPDLLQVAHPLPQHTHTHTDPSPTNPRVHKYTS